MDTTYNTGVITVQDPPQNLEGFDVIEKKRIDLENYRNSSFPNVQIMLSQNDEQKATVVVSLETLVNNNFVIQLNNSGAKLSFLWQTDLPPGLCTGCMPATNLLNMFENQWECADLYNSWLKQNKEKIGVLSSVQR